MGDLGGAHGGVNNNVYVTFPNNVGQYCDSGGAGGCAELDFVENNGNCAAATTFHTDPNGGDKGGTQTVNGIGSHVHVHASWDADGDTLTVMVDGHQVRFYCRLRESSVVGQWLDHTWWRSCKFKG